MRAIVTGSYGFIGRHMVKELIDRGWDDVVGCDLRPREWECKDLFSAPYPADLVVHCAARSPHRLAIDGDPGMHPYNVMLDAAMFDWAIRTQQPRVLYFSSCAAADGPIDGYAATKLTGEWMAEQARKAGVGVTIVRPYSGYGEDQSEDFPFRALIERAVRREDPFEIWGDGTQVRDWIHVDDIVRGSLAVVESGTTDTISLCTGVGTSIEQLAAMIQATAGYVPRTLRLTDKPAGMPYRVGDPSELHDYYRPTVSLHQGIERALGARHVGNVRKRL